MTQVKNQLFYHIHRLNNGDGSSNEHGKKWQIGNQLTFEDDYNGLWKRIVDFNGLENFSTDLQNHRILNYLGQIIDKIVPENEADRNFFTGSPLFQYLEFTRETVLERVRNQFFPHLPSRQKGIWLTDLENAQSWRTILGENCQVKVFKVRFTGVIHKADEAWITTDSLSLENYYKMAKGYWEGRIKEGVPTYEYLGVGKLEIVAEVCV